MKTPAPAKRTRTLPILLALAAVSVAVAAAYLMSGGDKPEHHGRAFSPAATVVDLTMLTADPKSVAERDIRVTGRITRQCPASGCWFILKSDTGAEFKVEMGDYTPQLPKHVGHTATVEGRLIAYGDGYAFIGQAVDFKKP